MKEFDPGTRVRLKVNPGRMGVTTDKISQMRNLSQTGCHHEHKCTSKLLQ